jgi:biotin synthase-like enzyme
MTKQKSPTLKEKHLKKYPIGITGFDDITDGILPKGRIALVYGNTGLRKTLIAMGFLVKGADSIFTDHKLPTMPDPGASEDHRLMAYLGLRAPEMDQNCGEGCSCEKLRA